ncbi:MAG: hypothetical protein QW767_03025 [Thermoprotei archaeon]
MVSKTPIEVGLAVLAFVPFGAALAYFRLHGGSTPSAYLNLALFALYAVIVGIIFFAEKKYKIFADE